MMEFKQKDVCQFEYHYGDGKYICLKTTGMMQQKECNPEICPIWSITQSLKTLARNS